MQAIATLVSDDPYLRMPAKERMLLRKQRQERFRKLLLEKEPQVLPSSILDIVPKMVVLSDPVITHIELISEWAEKQIQKYKPVWFGIVSEIEPAEKPKPRMEDIQRATAKYYGIYKSDLLSARRTANIVLPRQVAMFIAKALTLKSLPEIGRRFGDRDHTTVLHAVRKIERLKSTDEKLAAEIEAIKATLEGNQDDNLNP